MPTETKTKVITITGKRWFSRTYGNTYFSCVIGIDGERVHATDGYEYGYGDMYQQWACEWLKDNGHLPGLDGIGDGTLSIYCRENNIALWVSVSDVARRKDL